MFLATRLPGGDVSILSLERASLPLDIALAKHRPSVLEFYTGCCEVCRELVPDGYKVQLFTCCFVSMECSYKRVLCRWSRSMGTESTLCCSISRIRSGRQQSTGCQAPRTLSSWTPTVWRRAQPLTNSLEKVGPDVFTQPIVKWYLAVACHV